MGNYSDTRIAWVYPFSGLAFYLQPVLREFAKVFPRVAFFTGEWRGYVPGCEDTFEVNVPGKSRFIKLHKSKTGYERGIHILSHRIILSLADFRPNVIFINGLSFWTLLVLLFKPLYKWRIVLIYSGSSPNVDMTDSRIRLIVRQMMMKNIDAAITNSQAGKQYLVDILKLSENRIFARPYQMPDKQALSESADIDLDFGKLQRPVFLFVGQAIYRKGILSLLQSCEILKAKGIENYTVIVAGDGKERSEFEALAVKQGLKERVKWLGWIEYGKLGACFESSDVFVFPTLEDIWGMVVLEAMLFAKPVLCSKFAGAEELLEHGETGFIFDPHKPEELAGFMQSLIEKPELMEAMGKAARRSIDFHTPEKAAEHLSKVVEFVLNDAEQ